MQTEAVQREIQNAVTLLAGRWGGVGTNILLPAFRILARGSPVSVAELAESSGRDTPEVAQTLQTARQRDLVSFDKENRLAELYGIRFSGGTYRIQFKEGTLFSCCALVSLMVGPLVGSGETMIDSEDPVTRTPIRLQTTRTGIAARVPAETVGTMVTLRASDLRGAISAAVCNHIRYFSASQSAQQFSQADPRRFVVSLNELQSAASQLCLRVWNAGPPANPRDAH